MTAPEPTPADEHIDAVARVFSDDRDACGVVAWTNRFVGEQIAKLLLTSTDPAVHEALAANLPADVMLDALVRAGVLTEDRERLVRACGCIANEEPAACCDPLASPHWERRLVTPWEVAP